MSNVESAPEVHTSVINSTENPTHVDADQPARGTTITALRRGWAAIESALLTLLALLGLVCIAAVIAAFVFHINLIMFKTGSMAPTIPSGSLAVVREIPAAEVEVGDVTTISRGENELPITHRVISVTPMDNGSYSIEMKGDANDSPDPRPYEVDTVKKVIWHAPKLAYFVADIGTPKSMAIITLCMSALVVWVFWPKKVSS